MFASKKVTLKPLLESQNGIHLSAYLVNRGSVADLVRQLQDSINQAYEWLYPVMSMSERNKFLEPLDALVADHQIFQNMNGNIGIFRNQDSFRILNIPVDVPQSCQVATTFHIKPLLKWLQFDQEFLMAGISEGNVCLYSGSQTSLKLIESIEFTLAPANGSQKLHHEEQTVSWLSDLISQLTRTAKPKLFLVGQQVLLEGLKKKLKYKNSILMPTADPFEEEGIEFYCEAIRKTLREDAHLNLEKTLQEFRLAEEDNRARKNIFQISRAVVRGQVRKLVISEDLSIFGKIDKESGGLALHPFALDHEDDDILDDLAQMVLNQGGEVIVASKEKIPNGRPILAIVDNEPPEIQKLKATQNTISNQNYLNNLVL